MEDHLQDESMKVFLQQCLFYDFLFDFQIDQFDFMFIMLLLKVC